MAKKKKFLFPAVLACALGASPFLSTLAHADGGSIGNPSGNYGNSQSYDEIAISGGFPQYEAVGYGSSPAQQFSSMTNGSSGVSCTSAQNGEMAYQSNAIKPSMIRGLYTNVQTGEYRYCSGGTWYSMTGLQTGQACKQAGLAQDFNGYPVYCDGSQYYYMEPPNSCGGYNVGSPPWSASVASPVNQCGAGIPAVSCQATFQCVPGPNDTAITQQVVGTLSCTCGSCSDNGVHPIGGNWTDHVGNEPNYCGAGNAGTSCTQAMHCGASGSNGVVQAGAVTCTCSKAACGGADDSCSSGTVSDIHNKVTGGCAPGHGGITETTIQAAWDCTNGADTVACLGSQNHTFCFPSDSPILLTEYGDTEKIQDVQVGGKIISWDPETKSLFSDTVTRVIVHPAETRVLLEILLEDGTRIQPTPNHPIWLEEAGAYVKAQEIADRMLTQDCTVYGGCMHLQSATGELLRVIDVHEINDSRAVYDISVKGSRPGEKDQDSRHNFFVDGILVHNKPINVSCE